MTAPIQRKTVALEILQRPHNGEGRPDLQFCDPYANNELIGGQVAMIRYDLRFKRSVYCCGRRTGKTTYRPWRWMEEAALTSGFYYAGFVAPDHSKAYEIMDFTAKQLGGLVQEVVGDPRTQHRYLLLKPSILATKPHYLLPWDKRWERTQEKPNEGSRIYFWSGAYQYVDKIQGFPHPFDRIDVDEMAQQHPYLFDIVMPMLMDSGGSLTCTGYPDDEGPGNAKFQELYENGLPDSPLKTWCCLRFPSGINPHVRGSDEQDADITTPEKRLQLLEAKFVSDRGSVFTNLDKTFVLPPLPIEQTPTWVRSLEQSAPLPSVKWWANRWTVTPGSTIALSLDWAHSEQGVEATILDVFDLTRGMQVAVFRIHGARNYVNQFKWVCEVADRFKATQLHCDSIGMGAPMAAFLRTRYSRGFVEHRFNASNKPNYVRQAQVALEEDAMKMLRFPEQLKEFRTFRRIVPDVENSEFTVRYTHPPGGSDDFVAAFLHVAPSISLGKRAWDADPMGEEEKPAFDAKGRTSLSLFGDDPFAEREGEPEVVRVEPKRR